MSSSSEEEDSFDVDLAVEALLPKAHEIVKGLTLSKFLDPSEPWVLVEGGSFAGLFDWVPERFRVGPWTTFATCFLTGLGYLVVLTGIFLATRPDPLWSTDLTLVEYPAAGSSIWMASTAIFLYLLWILWIISKRLTRLGKWATYTVQSFTLLTVRYGLVVAAPFSVRAKLWAEMLRFPTACSQTITFVVFNGFLLPIGYWVLFTNPLHRRRFWKWCFSFRLINLHMLNILFCIFNCGPYTSTPRVLDPIDFYLAVVSSVWFMAIYLLVFDRIGLHFYPPFSPRTGPLMVGTSWTLNLLCYWATFWAWKVYLMPANAIDHSHEQEQEF